jgi:hypothetical protein
MNLKTPLCLGIALLAHSVFADPLPAIATGDGPVNNFIDFRPNIALGVPVIANTHIPDFFPEYVTDGVLDDFVFPWIPLDGNEEPNWIILQLGIAQDVSAMVLQGRFDNRSQAAYTLAYTTDAGQVNETSTWVEIGTYTFAGGNVPMPRTGLATGTLTGVTGIRVATRMTANTLGASVQEIEVYGPYATAPNVFSGPDEASVVLGGRLTLSVDAERAEFFRWFRDDTLLEDHKGPTLIINNVTAADAGIYRVEVGNSRGVVESTSSQVTVNAPPTFDTYREAVLSDAPIRYYPLDETGGTTAGDSGSDGIAGTLSMGVTPGSPASSSRLGGAFRFNGAPGTLIDLGLFHPGNDVSVEAWVNLDTDAGTQWHAIVARWDGSYELDIAPGDVPNFVVRRDGNAIGVVAGPGPVARGQWHHLVGVFAGGVLTIYVNGVQGQETEIGGVLQDAGNAEIDRVMIGASRNGSEGSFNFKGLIDEVAIYSHGLPPEKIVAHYQTGLPDTAPEIGIELVAEIRWPSFPPGYVLQVNDDPSNEQGWVTVDVAGRLIARDGFSVLHVSVADAHRFYRLHLP